MRSANTAPSLLVLATGLGPALATRGDTRSFHTPGQVWASNSSSFAASSTSSWSPVSVSVSVSSLITNRLQPSSSAVWGGDSTKATSEDLGDSKPQRLFPDPSSHTFDSSSIQSVFSESVSLATSASPHTDSSDLSELSTLVSSSWSSTETVFSATSIDSVSSGSTAESAPKPSVSSIIIIDSPSAAPPPSSSFVTLTTQDIPIHSGDATEEPPLDCIPAKEEHKLTTISVVYTATTTFFGDPTDYVPPYPELTTPNLCPYPTSPEFGTGPGDDDGGDITGSYVTTICESEKDRKTCKTVTIDAPLITSQKTKSEWSGETITFVTTDKNPSVVYSPIKTPGFGKETYNGNDGVHQTKLPVPQTKLPRPNPTHKLTIEPTKVIIDSTTITVHPTETTRVTVDDRVFTINPTEIVGDGSTIRRPWNGQASRGTAFPSTTTIGSTTVVIAPAGRTSVVVIGDTTLTIPSGGTTAVVDGTTMTLSPTAIHFPDRIVVMNSEPPRLTEVFVKGGQMITAIGPTLLVIDGTTITYGKKTPAIVWTVEDEVITVGPSGVVVGSKTLGGPSAARQDTDIRIVGGATLTQIGDSILVIAGTTFTVGPNGDGPLTTNIGGEEITIGPDGVSFSTLSLAYPFGPTIVTTMVAEPTRTGSFLPAETEDDDNKGNALSCSLVTTILYCIAVGVWNLGYIY